MGEGGGRPQLRLAMAAEAYEGGRMLRDRDVLVLGVVFMRVMGLPLGPVLDNPTVSLVATSAVASAVIALAGWYLSRSLRTVFGLRGAGLWTITVLVVLALVGLLAGYSHLLFWSTALAVRLT